jgi:hypothetical protein
LASAAESGFDIAALFKSQPHEGSAVLVMRFLLVVVLGDPQSGYGVLALYKSQHKLDSISCTLFTAESENQSNADALQLEDGNDRRVLSYNCTNDPRVSVRGRSERHTGAAILKLATQPEMRLTGEYWTSRKTTGEMEFVFESRTMLEASG